MVIIGWNNLGLVDNVENDEGSNEVTQTIPVDKRSDDSVQNSKFNQVETGISPAFQAKGGEGLVAHLNSEI